ncbi:hypothetical protein BCR42DRAFT_485578 [Absidia repens]|uniref:RRM domain-containing protein n=1 Tax=Absidia repens TaxID=90262 RepID=A0A1X2J0V2_9FUNG|nr:hypothetical protein BCR42DRAFT_485578 [Absidia repens]
MSSAMDLDASLDDIIKKKRPQKQQQKKTHTPKHSQNKGKQQQPLQRQRQQQQQQQKQKQSGNKSGILGRLGPHGVQKNSKTNMKQTQQSGLNTPLRSRLGNQNLAKAITKSSATLQQTSSSANPSNIMITKHVSDRLSFGRQQQRQQQSFEKYHQPLQQQRSMEQPSVRENTSFSIRGMSAPSPGISIRGESGPASVLISNLDREANAADIKASAKKNRSSKWTTVRGETACAQFGEVMGCEVFYDRMGRSVGEAEVEFATKASALDCIAKLDNEAADGQILRVILREQPNKYIRQQEVRPAVKSSVAYPSTGKMYADQIDSSRYGVPSRRY